LISILSSGTKSIQDPLIKEAVYFSAGMLTNRITTYSYYCDRILRSDWQGSKILMEVLTILDLSRMLLNQISSVNFGGQNFKELSVAKTYAVVLSLEYFLLTKAFPDILVNGSIFSSKIPDPSNQSAVEQFAKSIGESVNSSRNKSQIEFLRIDLANNSLSSIVAKCLHQFHEDQTNNQKTPNKLSDHLDSDLEEEDDEINTDWMVGKTGVTSKYAENCPYRLPLEILNYLNKADNINNTVMASLFETFRKGTISSKVYLETLKQVEIAKLTLQFVWAKSQMHRFSFDDEVDRNFFVQVSKEVKEPFGGEIVDSKARKANDDTLMKISQNKRLGEREIRSVRDQMSAEFASIRTEHQTYQTELRVTLETTNDSIKSLYKLIRMISIILGVTFMISVVILPLSYFALNRKMLFPTH
jgi:hypothetical protein